MALTKYVLLGPKRVLHILIPLRVYSFESHTIVPLVRTQGEAQ